MNILGKILNRIKKEMLRYRYERLNVIIKSDRFLSEYDLDDMFIPTTPPKPTFVIGNYFPTSSLLFQPVNFTGTVKYDYLGLKIYIKVKNGKFEESSKIPAIDFRKNGFIVHYFFGESGLQNAYCETSYRSKVFETFDKTIDYDNIKNNDDLTMLHTASVIMNGKIFIPSKPATIIEDKYDYARRNKSDYLYSYNGIYSRSYNEYVKSWIEKHNKRFDLLTEEDFNFMQLEYKFERKHNAVSI
jgi:hypothetical protein